jgi:secreted Zn-dependent insulinase-like peptidase
VSEENVPQKVCENCWRMRKLKKVLRFSPLKGFTAANIVERISQKRFHNSGNDLINSFEQAETTLFEESNKVFFS